ncbi:MAG TPA: sigma-70 family RNA polymerase sigma factor [Polyangiaceae bacterium]|nr:sigma-70 family RNA polymerase sigma factor [Polyangiaceae bacterium]
MVTSARQHLPERTDRELVTAAREGDAEAFGLLVRRHQRRVYRLAVHLLKSGAEAEDVTQDTFVRAYGALDRFDGRSEPFTWIYRICVNLSLNALRSRKTRRASSPDDPRIEGLLVDNRPAGGSPQRSTSDKQLGRALLEGIDDLSDTLRTTLVLVCIDGLSHAEAGEVLGCPEGTVAWRVHEARKKLRGMLSERGFDDDDIEGKE